MINFEAFFKVTYGLYVVTSGDSEKSNGFISNAVFQVTAEPPQFAVCCNKDNYTADMIKNSGLYVISVLNQKTGPEVIGNFGYKSGRNTDKMQHVNVIKGKTGVPVVTTDTIAYLECRLKQTFDVGTHLIYVGEVVSAEVLSGDDPLTYEFYRNVKKGLAPKNAPTYIDKSRLEGKNKGGKD